MSLRRVVLSIVLAAGCGKGDAPPERAAAQPVQPDAASAAPVSAADAAAAAATLDIPFQLPPAQNAVPLPASAGAYIFVPAQGALRVGTSPSFAAATEAGNLDSLRKLIPPSPDSAGILDLKPGDVGPIGTGRYGTIGGGAPQGYGVGAGGGGTYVAHALTAYHAEPAKARIVVVADRGTDLKLFGELVKSSLDLYAIAVVGADGRQGALPLVVSSQASGGERYQIYITGMGAEVLDTSDGSMYQTPAGPHGLLDRAALNQHLAELFASPAGADAPVGVFVDARAFLSDLVAGLDATAPGKHPVGVTIRGRVSGMRGRNSSAVPLVQVGQPSSNGQIDKAIIRRYIKRNIQKILYCYEKQLLAVPGLEGTVNAQFVIAPDGKVATSKASGVSPEVSTCVADVIFRIEFPKPASGGIVPVTYPFNFRPTGG